jgi:hypothetical protein
VRLLLVNTPLVLAACLACPGRTREAATHSTSGMVAARVVPLALFLLGSHCLDDLVDLGEGSKPALVQLIVAELAAPTLELPQLPSVRYIHPAKAAALLVEQSVSVVLAPELVHGHPRLHLLHEPDELLESQYRSFHTSSLPREPSFTCPPWILLPCLVTQAVGDHVARSRLKRRDLGGAVNYNMHVN